MTYPPQPPGPPQGPYGPPPPGPPRGPYNQGPYPYQQPQWGYPVGPPPKKPRTGLIATLIVVAILVVGGGGVGAYLLLSKDDRGEGSGRGGGEGGGARAAAQTYVRELEKALNTPPRDVDLGKLRPVTCGDDFAKMEDELDEAKDLGQSDSAGAGPGTGIRLRIKDFERTADGATFTMTERVPGDGDSDSRDLTVTQEGGGWKVCGLYQDGDHSGSGGGSSPTRAIPPNPIPTT